MKYRNNEMFINIINYFYVDPLSNTKVLKHIHVIKVKLFSNKLDLFVYIKSFHHHSSTFCNVLNKF